MSASTSWQKAPPELVEQFQAAVAGIDGVEVRPMFGYPAAFVGGNLTAGLFRDTMMVRLPAAEREACLEAGWSPLEPMPGRPMREYLVLPREVVADAAATRTWVETAAAFVRTLPPKETKRKKAPTA